LTSKKLIVFAKQTMLIRCCGDYKYIFAKYVT